MEMAENCMFKLTSSTKLDRDKGVDLLQQLLETESPATVKELENIVLKYLNSCDEKWESLLGALLACKLLILHSNVSTEFTDIVLNCNTVLLEHSEYRVRIAAGEVLGVLCQSVGSVVYSNTKRSILDGIQNNLEREYILATDPQQLPGTNQMKIHDASQIFHESAGWKSLETWMKCLQSVIEGCGPQFNQFIDQTLLDLIFKCVKHTNRFVRESGYYVLASLVCWDLTSQDTECQVFGDQVADFIAQGLADNWSMVRLAGSVAVRNFLKSLASQTVMERYLPVLLPRMCLNRYYAAEGVRNYSQETWRDVCGEKGKDFVEKYLDDVVKYYIDQTKAENHAVREAACVCVAELGYKIAPDKLQLHVRDLLDTLIICFNDDSWPVRDSACVACGNFIKCFPEESRSSLSVLFPLFFNNLQDTIPSVRQGASEAITNILHAYGQEYLALVIDKIKEGLSNVVNQASESKKYAGLESGLSTYRVIKRLRDNDMDLHSGQQMYSCGSLAPKMGSGRKGGGCIDHFYRRPSEPWELADGCINLVADLSSLGHSNDQIIALLPLVVEASSHRHYTQHVVLLATLCDRLPDIAKALGKRTFKTHLEIFFDPIFYSLNCDNELASSAAEFCLKQLSSYIGFGILRGRIEIHNSRFLPQFDAHVPAV